MNTVEKLQEKFLEINPKFSEILNIHKGILHLNCADHQTIYVNNNNEYQFGTVGGSRYYWLERFDNEKDCVEFCIKNIICKTNEQIDNEYKQIWKGLK